MEKSSVFFGTFIVTGALFSLGLFLYLFLIVMSMMGSHETNLVTNDLAYAVEARIATADRTGTPPRLCVDGTKRCPQAVEVGDEIRFTGNEDQQFDYMVLTSPDGSQEMRCFNFRIDNVPESQATDLLNLLAFRGYVRQSNISQHPVITETPDTNTDCR